MFFLQRCTIVYYVECWTICESYRRSIGEREGIDQKSLHPRLARYKLAVERQRRKSLGMGFGIDGAFVKMFCATSQCLLAIRCEAQGILGYNKESSKRFQKVC